MQPTKRSGYVSNEYKWQELFVELVAPRQSQNSSRTAWVGRNIRLPKKVLQIAEQSLRLHHFGGVQKEPAL